MLVVVRSLVLLFVLIAACLLPAASGASAPPQSELWDSVLYLQNHAPKRLAPHFGCVYKTSDGAGSIKRVFVAVSSPRVSAAAKQLVRKAGSPGLTGVRLIDSRFADRAMTKVYAGLARSAPKGADRTLLHVVLHHPYGDLLAPPAGGCPGWEILLYESAAAGEWGEWARRGQARYGSDRVTIRVVPDGSGIPQ